MPARGELLEADALANGATDGRSHLAIAQRLRTGDDQGLAFASSERYLKGPFGNWFAKASQKSDELACPGQFGSAHLRKVICLSQTPTTP